MVLNPQGGVNYYSLHFSWQYIITVAFARFIPLDIHFNWIVIDTLMFPFVLTWLDANPQIDHCQQCWRTWTPFASMVSFVGIARFYQRSQGRGKHISIHVLFMILSALSYTILDNFLLLYMSSTQIQTAWFLDVSATLLLFCALLIQENALRFDSWIIALTTYSVTQIILSVGHQYCHPDFGCSTYLLGQCVQLIQICFFLIGPSISRKLSQRYGKCQWVAATATTTSTVQSEDGEMTETTTRFSIGADGYETESSVNSPP